MRCACYYRVSSEDQKEARTIEAQKDKLPRYAKSQNWKVVKEYTDDGISGTTLNRPAFQNLLKDMVNKQFDVLLVTQHDRLLRSESSEERGLVIDTLKRNNIKLASPSEGLADLSNFSGEFMATVRFMWAAEENRIRKERQQGGKQRKFRENKWGSGKLPYGIRYIRSIKDEKGNQIKKEIFIVDEQEKETFLLAVDLLLNKGMSVNRITQTFNDEGVKTRGGKKWYSATLGDILKNPLYYTMKKSCWNTKTIEVDGKRRSRPLSPEEKAEIGVTEPLDFTKHGVEPFIDEFKHYEIVNTIQKNKSISKSMKDDQFLMRGLLFCRMCGAPLTSFVGKYYTCVNKILPESLLINGRKRCPTAASIRKDVIEDYFWNELVQCLSDPQYLLEAIDDKQRQKTRIKGLQLRKAKIEKRIDRTDGRSKRLTDIYLDGNIAKEELYDKRNELNKEKHKLEIDLKIINRDLKDCYVKRTTLQEIKDKLDLLPLRDKIKQTFKSKAELIQLFEKLPFDTKRELVRVAYKPGFEKWDKLLIGSTKDETEEVFSYKSKPRCFATLDNFFINLDMDNLLNILKSTEIFNYLNLSVEQTTPCNTNNIRIKLTPTYHRAKLQASSTLLNNQ